MTDESPPAQARTTAYVNRLPDESVNYSKEHPLPEFAWLVAGVLTIVVVGSALVIGFAGTLAAHIPFDTERDIAQAISTLWSPPKASSDGLKVQEALTVIAERLVKAMPEAKDITINVYLDERPIVNAAATIGGNIVMYRGLLEKLDSEDAVAMVLAHEIAHAALRHPPAHLGRGISLSLIMATLSTTVGVSDGSKLFQMAGSLPMLKYGRDQESEADAAGVAALVSVYGHIGGAADLFGVFRQAGEGVEFLQTHPLTSHRISDVENIARKNGWATDGVRKPLPESIRSLK